MIKINKKNIITRLSNEGTFLDDDCINDILNFLTTLYPRRDNIDTVEVVIADSCLIERYMLGVKRTRKDLRPSNTRLKSGKVILYILPIYFETHWSLLVRVPRLKCWLHFDSIDGYHRKYAMKVASVFDKEIYNNEEDDDDDYDDNDDNEYEFIYFEDAPQQKYGWECGIYLLMYGYVMIHFSSEYTHEDDAKDLFRYLKKHIPATNESKRKMFVSSIITLLKRDIH